MSKILFVTQTLTIDSLNQIEIIKRSGHEFCVVTSQSEKKAELKHSDTLYFFTKWSFLELIRFLPSFMSINPDIVHVFVDSQSSAKAANFFASLTQLFNKIFSLQFFLSEDSFLKLKQIRKLVYLADVVAGPHRSFLYNLRGMKAKNKYQIKGVIPPVLHLKSYSPSKPLNPRQENEFKAYEILLPLKKNSYDERLIYQLAQNYSILFFFEMDAWTPLELKKLNHSLSLNSCRPWRLFPVESLKDLTNIPQGPFYFWLAGLTFELDECIQFFQFGLTRNMKIIMDQTQAKLYPDFWEHNSMAIILNENKIKSILASGELNLTLTTPGNDTWIENLNSSSLVDISVNEFNRLISKATNTQNEKNQ